MPMHVYDIKAKMDALIMVRDSGMSMKEVAETVGVHWQTLQRWKAQYYDEVFKKPSEIKVESEKEFQTVQLNLMHRYRNLLEMSADRFEELIPKTKNLDALQRATLTIAKLARFIDGDGPTKDPSDETSPIQFFQQINQHYINKYQDEKKTIDISGDPEE